MLTHIEYLLIRLVFYFRKSINRLKGTRICFDFMNYKEFIQYLKPIEFELRTDGAYLYGCCVVGSTDQCVVQKVQDEYNRRRIQSAGRWLWRT